MNKSAHKSRICGLVTCLCAFALSLNGEVVNLIFKRSDHAFELFSEFKKLAGINLNAFCFHGCENFGKRHFDVVAHRIEEFVCNLLFLNNYSLLVSLFDVVAYRPACHR